MDSGLLNAARAGDREAIGDLMAPHLARLRALAYRILANRDDAEDAVQEALARALDKIAGFRGEAGFATWLYRITVNVCRDVLRRRQRWRWDAQVHTRTVLRRSTARAGGCDSGRFVGARQS